MRKTHSVQPNAYFQITFEEKLRKSKCMQCQILLEMVLNDSNETKQWDVLTNAHAQSKQT
jgi:hypothetical protein